MTTHEQQRVIGILREDPKWDRNDSCSLWHKGWYDAYFDIEFSPRYFDSNNSRFVGVTDPKEVEEYGLGYRAGLEEYSRHHLTGQDDMLCYNGSRISIV